MAPTSNFCSKLRPCPGLQLPVHMPTVNGANGWYGSRRHSHFIIISHAVHEAALPKALVKVAHHTIQRLRLLAAPGSLRQVAESAALRLRQYHQTLQKS